MSKNSKLWPLFIKILFTLILFLDFSMLSAQNTTEVSTVDALLALLKNAQPGMEIILSKNLSISNDVTLTAFGTAEKPLIIRAKTTGKTRVTSEIKLAGDYISIIGLKFGGGNGNIIIDGKGCRLSQCIFSDSQARKWVRVRPGSSIIEIDHNLFENKSNNRSEKSCQLMQIVVRNENERHHIHHNLFKNIPPGSGNGYETLQLITEKNPFDPPGGECQTLIEDNLFLRCNGEAEIISIKSNGNIIRHNTFRACKGGLVLRHGDKNIATGNYFFGEGEPESGGIRLQGSDQVVDHNYFYQLGQYGIAMMDGTPDDLYVRVERAEIAFNTLIDCRKDLVIGLNHPKHPNGTPPKDCRIIGNIFYGESKGSKEPFIEFVQGDQPIDWIWKDNLAFGKSDKPFIVGIRMTDPHLKLKKKQLAVPTKRTQVLFAQYKETYISDLLGNPIQSPVTAGAIQFPVLSWKNRPLTENMVGPKAKNI